ncbi:MAG: DMT family transporter [Deltaproteobacteria bacterium]|nr:DMT family transporter [Deltaproteobacteria bacterium]
MRRAHALLALGVLSVGAAAPLIRLAHAPPVTAAFLRTLIGGVVLLAVASAWRRPLPRGPDLRRALVCGAVLGVHFALWFASLGMTTVAASTVLVCVQPVFVAALAWALLGERTPARGLIGIGVAVGGSVVIGLDLPGDAGAGGQPLVGNLLALAGAAVIAAYPIVARRVDRGVDTLAFSAVVSLAAAATLALCCLLTDSPLYAAHASWPALLALALLPTVIGQTALNAALKRLPAAFVSGAILGEPVIATAVAWLVLNERPGMKTLAGSALVLLGVGLLFSRAPIAVERAPTEAGR